jgi:hypothetical protein
MDPQEQSGGKKAKSKSRGSTPYKKILNPLTNRYIKATGQVANKLVKEGVIEKQCGKGQMVNPKTGRCVNVKKPKVAVPKKRVVSKKSAIKHVDGVKHYTY